MKEGIEQADQAAREKFAFLQRVREEEVDSPNTPQMYKEFVQFLDKNCTTPAHYLRYCQTFLAVVPYLGMLQGKSILETGGFCDITRFMKTNGYDCRKTSTDLRYEIDAEDESVDLLFSLEVIEHLKDQSESTLAEIVLFRGTGVSQYAAEVKRVLRPRGILVLTTPNPCSSRALELLLSYAAPMLFRPHVREYTRDELLQLFSSMERLEERTHYSFFQLHKKHQIAWKSVFERNGWDASGRGDDHFMVFRK